MKEVREYWCKSQGFTPAQTAQMFLIFKRRFRIYDSNSCQTIGVTVDPEGRVRVRGGTEGLVNENVHFEVVTEAEYQRLMARDEMEEEEEEEEEPEETLRLTLKTKGKDEFKIKVRPVSVYDILLPRSYKANHHPQKSTTITDLIQAYRKGRDVDDAKTVRLDFEGDILQPTDTIGDTELEDSCMVDVYIN